MNIEKPRSPVPLVDVSIATPSEPYTRPCPPVLDEFQRRALGRVRRDGYDEISAWHTRAVYGSVYAGTCDGTYAIWEEARPARGRVSQPAITVIYVGIDPQEARRIIRGERTRG